MNGFLLLVRTWLCLFSSFYLGRSGHGNWRSISSASDMAAAAILGSALKEYDVLASYKPSEVVKLHLLNWDGSVLK